jgi:AcrR family transcriptional regulator
MSAAAIPPSRRNGRGTRKGRLPHQLPAGRHGLPRSFVQRNQRERIVGSVIDVVSRGGYAGLTVRDVIARAGVSRRTFYEHFSNKEDVFLAAYDSVVEHVISEVRVAHAGGRTWPEAVGRGLAKFLGLLAGQPALAHVCIVEVLAAGPEALARRARAIEAFSDLVSPDPALLPRGHTVPPLAMEVVVGGIYEIVFSYVSRGESYALPTIWPELLFSMLLPFEGAKRAAAAVEAARRIGDQSLAT